MIMETLIVVTACKSNKYSNQINQPIKHSNSISVIALLNF